MIGTTDYYLSRTDFVSVRLIIHMPLSANGLLAIMGKLAFSNFSLYPTPSLCMCLIFARTTKNIQSVISLVPELLYYFFFIFWTLFCFMGRCHAWSHAAHTVFSTFTSVPCSERIVFSSCLSTILKRTTSRLSWTSLPHFPFWTLFAPKILHEHCFQFLLGRL